MKRAVLGVILCLSLAVFGFSGGFSIKLNGGANFLMGGDYNTIIGDMNDEWHSYPSLTVASDLSKLSLGWNFGAEFIYNITEEMGLGLGIGYITATNESTLRAQNLVAYEAATFTPSVSAIPITLNFHYALALGETMKFQFNIGPGLYISSFRLIEDGVIGLLPSTELIVLTVDYQPEGVVAFGFQGGLGIEFALSPSISLCLDVLGRMANPSGFAGPWTQSGTVLGIPFSSSGSGTMYYYEQGGYSHFEIMSTIPSGSGVSNAREASVSLSGVAAQFGIKINI